MFLVSRKKQC